MKSIMIVIAVASICGMAQTTLTANRIGKKLDLLQKYNSLISHKIDYLENMIWLQRTQPQLEETTEPYERDV